MFTGVLGIDLDAYRYGLGLPHLDTNGVFINAMHMIVSKSISSQLSFTRGYS